MKEQVARLAQLFKGTHGITRSFLRSILTLNIEMLLEIMIEKSRMEITAADTELIELTKQMARRHCVRGKHHTFSYIRGESGTSYPGKQRTYHRCGDAETCAEEGAISNLSFAQEAGITVVTVHFMPVVEREDGGVTSIVPPCSTCATRLRITEIEQEKTLGVIIYHKGQIIKVPARIAMLFNYPAKHDNEK